jgi:hypothetical protein
MQDPLQSPIATHLIPVQNREQLQWLVKESEMLTGRPGREFFLVGDDRPALNVLLDHTGHEIVANGCCNASDLPRQAGTQQLRELTLDLAFFFGLLFTTPIQ